MSSELPLSADAKKILCYCVENERQVNDWIDKDTLSRELGLRVDEVWKAMNSLQIHALVESQSEHGIWSVTPQGRDAVYDNFKRPSANQANFTFTGPIYGNVINSNTGTASSSYVFNELEREIERRGGDDVDELKEMVQEIRDLLSDEDSLHHGVLAQYSTLMERHSWITGNIAGIILGWLTGGVS